MDVNGRVQFRETPGSARVIEMDVAEEHVADVARIETMLGGFARDIVEGRFRAGIEKDRAIVCLEQSRRDDAGPAEMLGIENVDHSPPRGVKLGRGFFGATPRAV